MKTKLCLLFLAIAATASAQLQLINVGTAADAGVSTITIPGVCTNVPYTITSTTTNAGERIGRSTWQHLNGNDLLLLSLANTAGSNALADIPSTRIPSTLVYQTSLIPLMQSNPFVFSGGSNFLGTFTNIFSIQDIGYNGGTNQPLTNMMSLDGGTTWQAYYRTNPLTTNFTDYVFTNYFGTNFTVYTNTVTNYFGAPVQLSVLSGLTSTGYANVYAISDPLLIGRRNTFPGQSFDFTDCPVSGLTNGMAVISSTNFISGQIYTNRSGGTMLLTATADLTIAAVAGAAQMDLQSANQSAALATIASVRVPTGAASVIGDDYRQLGGAVTNGQIYSFTNQSTGAGNAASVISGTGRITVIP